MKRESKKENRVLRYWQLFMNKKSGGKNKKGVYLNNKINEER
tara:strand:- start:110 stop:235 length:126 start_codon:yes stop_codon:yes gene_type:complete